MNTQEITYSKEIKKLLSGLRHPATQQTLKSRVTLHPLVSDCIYIEIADNADAQITAHHFDEEQVIYTIELYVDNVDGDTKEVFSWTTTDWKEMRSKVLELKAGL